MTIPLDIVRTRGRAPVELHAQVARELTGADVALLGTEKGVKPKAVVRLRERHHALARNIASGMREADAAAVSGYDLSRVSILKGDPAFQELIAFYKEDVDKAYANLHETLAGMSLDAALIIRDRMEEEPEKLKTDQLLEITKMGADRTGHGPKSTVDTNINVNLANRLEEARKRIAARTIELTANVIEAAE
jgi:hypothetical protein